MLANMVVDNSHIWMCSQDSKLVSHGSSMFAAVLTLWSLIMAAFIS
jgi:hypothetical protein